MTTSSELIPSNDNIREEELTSTREASQEGSESQDKTINNCQNINSSSSTTAGIQKSVAWSSSTSSNSEANGNSNDLNDGPNCGSGYYNAEKCRAFIANRIKVNKISRFAAQITKIVYIESSNEREIQNILDTFNKHWSHLVHDFTLKCKLGVQSHRQDRILNGKRKLGPTNKRSPKKHQQLFDNSQLDNNLHQNTDHHQVNNYNNHQEQASTSNRLYYYQSISNDLLYGQGAQLVHTLLSNQLTTAIKTLSNKFDNKHIMNIGTSELSSFQLNEDGFLRDSDGEPYIKKERLKSNKNHLYSRANNLATILTEDDYILSDSFEPKIYVKKLTELLESNLRKSQAIKFELTKIGQTFERLAHQHKDNVDKVYEACQVKDSGSVTRRSAYNLSMAAIKATSIPVNVTNNLNSSSNNRG